MPIMSTSNIAIGMNEGECGFHRVDLLLCDVPIVTSRASQCIRSLGILTAVERNKKYC